MVNIELPLRFENLTYGLFGIILGGAFLCLLYFSYKRLRIAEKRLELVRWQTIRRVVKFTNIGMKFTMVTAFSLLLAGPYLPTTIEVPLEAANEAQMAQYSVSLMILMDVSFSMNISDLKPTRLQVAKSTATLLVGKMSPNDLVGFVSFAGGIHNTVFPTPDRKIIKELIDNQTVYPSTAIGTALQTAVGMLGPYKEGRAIVLFSDGGNNFGIDPANAIEGAVASKIPIFTVFVGTYGIWDADPLALREICDRTGGNFYEIRNENVESLLQEVSKISQEVKVNALKAVSDTLTIEAKDYETPKLVFSVLLVVSLFLTWFIGV